MAGWQACRQLCRGSSAQRDGSVPMPGGVRTCPALCQPLWSKCKQPKPRRQVSQQHQSWRRLKATQLGVWQNKSQLSLGQVVILCSSLHQCKLSGNMLVQWVDWGQACSPCPRNSMAPTLADGLTKREDGRCRDHRCQKGEASGAAKSLCLWLSSGTVSGTALRAAMGASQPQKCFYLTACLWSTHSASDCKDMIMVFRCREASQCAQPSLVRKPGTCSQEHI